MGVGVVNQLFGFHTFPGPESKPHRYRHPLHPLLTACLAAFFYLTPSSFNLLATQQVSFCVKKIKH